MNSYGSLPQTLGMPSQDICANVNLWQKRTIFNAKASMVSQVDDLANYLYELDSILDELIEFQKTFRNKFKGPDETATEVTTQMFLASMEQVGNVILSLQNLHEQVQALWQPWNELFGNSKYSDIFSKYSQPSKFDALPLAAQERTEDLRVALETYELGSSANASLTVWNNLTSQCLRRRDEVIESFHQVLSNIYTEMLQDESESLFFRVLYSKLLRISRKKTFQETESQDTVSNSQDTVSYFQDTVSYSQDTVIQQKNFQKEVGKDLGSLRKVQNVESVKSPRFQLEDISNENYEDTSEDTSDKTSKETILKPKLSAEAQRQVDLLTTGDPDFTEQKRRYRKIVLQVHPDKTGGDRTQQDFLQEAVASLKTNEPQWSNLAGGFQCKIDAIKYPHELNKYKYNYFRRILQNNLPYENQARSIVLAKNQLVILFEAYARSPLAREVTLDISEFPNNEVVNLTRKYLRPRLSVEPLPKYLSDPDLEKLIQDYIKVFSKNDQEASQISKKTFQKILRPLSYSEQDAIRQAQKKDIAEPNLDSVELELDRGEIRLEAIKSEATDDFKNRPTESKNQPTESLDIQSLAAKFTAGHSFVTPAVGIPSGLLINGPFEVHF